MKGTLDSDTRQRPDSTRVTVAAEPLDDVVRIGVADTGPGIPQDLRDHIFERYSQAGRSDHGGAGLGLPMG